jgi:hypothetical protein
MFTKIAVRWFSVWAIVVSGLFSGVAFAAPGGPACPLMSASIARQECLAAGASASQADPAVAASNSAGLPGQEMAVLSEATGNPAGFALLSSQAAANSVDMSVQEEVVLSAPTGNSATFASLASQPAAIDHTVQEEVVLSAATGSAALEYQPNDGSFHTPQTSNYQPTDPSFHTPQTSDYQP